MRIKLYITVLISLLYVGNSYAQKVWTLEECIKYAIENNIDVKQSQLSIQQSEIAYQSAKNDRLPTVGGSLGGSIYFGRAPSRDGTTMDTNIQHSGSLGASTSLSLYEGGRLKNSIEARNFALQSTIENYAAAKESVALQIVGLYMQVLFQYEIYRLAEMQVNISNELVERNNDLLENGKITQKDYYESRSLLANDKLLLTESLINYQQSLLNLSQALNWSSEHEFKVDLSQISNSSRVEPINLPSLESIYLFSENSRPSIKSEKLRLKELEYNYKIVKAAAMPSISLSASYGTSYFYAFNNTTGIPNIALIDQLGDNGNQSVGLSLNIPIFNKFSVRNQKYSARLNITSQQLAIDKSKQALRKEIEQAYYSALQSWERLNASSESLEATKKAFEFAKVSVEEGKTTIYDYNSSKNLLLKSESEFARAKYEYLLNCKIVNFYNGSPLY